MIQKKQALKFLGLYAIFSYGEAALVGNRAHSRILGIGKWEWHTEIKESFGEKNLKKPATWKNDV